MRGRQRTMQRLNEPLARTRYKVALEIGHGRNCAMAFARYGTGSLERCVCNLRGRRTQAELTLHHRRIVA